MALGAAAPSGSENGWSRRLVGRSGEGEPVSGDLQRDFIRGESREPGDAAVFGSGRRIGSPPEVGPARARRLGVARTFPGPAGYRWPPSGRHRRAPGGSGSRCLPPEDGSARPGGCGFRASRNGHARVWSLEPLNLGRPEGVVPADRKRRPSPAESIPEEVSIEVRCRRRVRDALHPGVERPQPNPQEPRSTGLARNIRPRSGGPPPPASEGRHGPPAMKAPSTKEAWL